MSLACLHGVEMDKPCTSCSGSLDPRQSIQSAKMDLSEDEIAKLPKMSRSFMAKKKLQLLNIRDEIDKQISLLDTPKIGNEKWTESLIRSGETLEKLTIHYLTSRD